MSKKTYSEMTPKAAKAAIRRDFETLRWGCGPRIIRDPGKFEGEPDWAVYFYDLVLEGFSDQMLSDGDSPIDVFRIGADVSAAWPDLNTGDYVILQVSDQGFLHSNVISEDELAKLEDELAEEDEDDWED